MNRVKFSLNLILIRASGYVEYSLRLGDVFTLFVAVQRKLCV